MAALFRLAANNAVIRSQCLTRAPNSLAVLCNQSLDSKRFFWGKEKTVDGRSIDASEIRLADPVEHATGLEKMLKLAEEKGIDDPFCLKPRKRGPGTKENPNLIPSFENKRLIGCLCEEDQTHVNYMWVHLGEPKRCECGHWFKAVPARKFWEEIDYKPGA